jgi:hypothetical protein
MTRRWKSSTQILGAVWLEDCCGGPVTNRRPSAGKAGHRLSDASTSKIGRQGLQPLRLPAEPTRPNKPSLRTSEAGSGSL